jgi:hypothetical protein
MVDHGLTILVGDANGADRALQAHFAERGYSDVIVYCSNNVCRNNLGNWSVRCVETDARPGSRSFYEAKDLAMARDAEYGLMIWDGHSSGTLNNILILTEQRKIVSVYVTCDKSFYDLKNASQLELFLEEHHPEARRSHRPSKLEASLFGPDSKRDGDNTETKAHYG